MEVVVRFGGNGILIVMMINRRRGRAAAANGHDELERGERGRERQTDFQYTDRLTHIHTHTLERFDHRRLRGRRIERATAETAAVLLQDQSIKATSAAAAERAREIDGGKTRELYRGEEGER